MDNPMLIPIAGGLAIVLLLGLLLTLRRKARRAAPESETPADDQHLDDQHLDGEHPDAEGHEHADDTDLVPMVTYADEPGDEAAHDGFERPVPFGTDEADELGEGDAWHAEVPPGPEPVNVRYLRAQVRTLQETLEQVQDVPDPERGGTQKMERFRRQVTAALRGLGERTREDESPERTLARVVATIERLDAPDEVARPVLPTVKFDLSGAQMTLAGPQYVAAPAALSQAPIVRIPAPEPAPEMVPAMAAAPESAPAAPAQPSAPPAGPTVTTPLASALAAGAYDDELPVHGGHAAQGLTNDPFAQDEQVLPPPADPDVVLPVPPPSAQGGQRSRRWSRRHGA